jgi:hypothetical protein
MPRRNIGAACGLACIAIALCAGAAPVAAEETAAGDCNGVGFDVRKPLMVARIVPAAPRVFFVRSSWEDASCPAETPACRSKAYLVPGDLVLVGRTNGPYTCVAYQSPRDKKQIWTNGWITSASLVPVTPSRAPRLADWVGTWSHTGGEITIDIGEKGMLSIEGEHTYPAGGGAHSGVIGALAKPVGGILAFADDGEKPFDKAEEGDCQVRMQRVGALLLVEDNGYCGGSMVTFTGLYRRKP